MWTLQQARHHKGGQKKKKEKRLGEKEKEILDYFIPNDYIFYFFYTILTLSLHAATSTSLTRVTHTEVLELCCISDLIPAEVTPFFF